MLKRVVIHQPDFLPYLGFFHRFLHADLWIVLDHVQFVSKGGSWHYRDKIKTAKGEQWLSLSVKKSELGTPINKIRLSDSVDWRMNNLNLLRENYAKAPYFKEIYDQLDRLYKNSTECMDEFNLASIEMINSLLDIRIETIRSSSLNPKGNKNEMLIDLIKKVNGGVYLSGVGARDYMNDNLFHEAGIEVVYQDFKHPVYPQLHGEFIPYLSTIDLLFNCGINRSREIIRSC